MRCCMLILLLAMFAVGCGDPGKGKNKESFQDIPKPAGAKPEPKQP